MGLGSWFEKELKMPMGETQWQWDTLRGKHSLKDAFGEHNRLHSDATKELGSNVFTENPDATAATIAAAIFGGGALAGGAGAAGGGGGAGAAAGAGGAGAGTGAAAGGAGGTMGGMSPMQWGSLASKMASPQQGGGQSSQMQQQQRMAQMMREQAQQQMAMQQQPGYVNRSYG